MNNRACTTNAFYRIRLENCCRWKKNPKEAALKPRVIRSPLIIHLHLVTIMIMLYLDREQSVMASLMKLFCFYSYWRHRYCRSSRGRGESAAWRTCVAGFNWSFWCCHVAPGNAKLLLPHRRLPQRSSNKVLGALTRPPLSQCVMTF